MNQKYILWALSALFGLMLALNVHMANIAIELKEINTFLKSVEFNVEQHPQP